MIHQGEHSPFLRYLFCWTTINTSKWHRLAFVFLLLFNCRTAWRSLTRPILVLWFTLISTTTMMHLQSTLLLLVRQCRKTLTSSSYWYSTITEKMADLHFARMHGREKRLMSRIFSITAKITIRFAYLSRSINSQSKIR